MCQRLQRTRPGARCRPGWDWALPILMLGLITLLSLAASLRPEPVVAASSIYGVHVHGVINELTADHILKVLSQAEEQRAVALLVTIDSPGGVDAATRRIAQAFLAARIPVLVYVGPDPQSEALSGAMFITLAGHIAAMSPDATIGAGLPAGLVERASPEERQLRIDEALQIAIATAEARERNVDTISEIVRDERVLTADEALESAIIDHMASSVSQLLDQVDGSTVRTATGPVTLTTQGVAVDWISRSWRERVVQAITDPNVAYLLWSTGVMLLILALYAPGRLLAGIPGVLALITASIAFGNLPISWIGLGLLILGAVLFIAELYTPRVGLPGTLGVLAYIVGSFLLYQPVRQDSPFAPTVRVNPWLIVGTASFFVITLLLILRSLVRSRRAAAAEAAQALVGQRAVVVRALEPEGAVRVGDDEWPAIASDEPVGEGAIVVIIGATTGVLHVASPPAPITPTEPSAPAHHGQHHRHDS